MTNWEVVEAMDWHFMAQFKRAKNQEFMIWMDEKVQNKNRDPKSEG
jgi:hypothetical protein